MKQGLLYIFTGDGKGKTSAALGVALRACCANLKVAWVAWYKQASWQTCESNIVKLLPIDVFLLGKGFHLKTKNLKLRTKRLKTGAVIVDKVSEEEHKLAADAALTKAQEILKMQKYDVLICDEINNALYEKLISLKSVKELIGLRKKTHLVLTGRNAHSDIITLADLVTDMKKVKHPYDQGIPALEGLDF
ncbi:cob(I)yrinic acid a,c-diamide adenosyltransferase [Candidatus Beckwithbacteria bacterium]|nr:cob(I)yrinic acid a,c-diamide adenosyltransferase [Candidatus Beckwithbacteria bacterium]